MLGNRSFGVSDMINTAPASFSFWHFYFFLVFAEHSFTERDKTVWAHAIILTQSNGSVGISKC